MAVRRLVATLTLCAVGATDSCGTAAGWELLDANRTALVVIDAQQNFLDKLPLAQRASLVERIAFVMKVAKAMELPILATAEDYAEGGSNPLMHPSLKALLPAGTHVWNKLVWNLYGQPDIRAAVDAVAKAHGLCRNQISRRFATHWLISTQTRGIDTFILVGLETDVCVAQSALGLKAAGYRAVVVEDAVATPPPHHAAGILRMRDAGVTVLDAKAAYYELVRDVPTVARVAREIGGAPVVGEDARPVEGCASDYTL